MSEDHIFFKWFAPSPIASLITEVMLQVFYLTFHSSLCLLSFLRHYLNNTKFLSHMHKIISHITSRLLVMLPSMLVSNVLLRSTSTLLHAVLSDTLAIWPWLSSQMSQDNRPCLGVTSTVLRYWATVLCCLTCVTNALHRLPTFSFWNLGYWSTSFLGLMDIETSNGIKLSP